MITQQEETSDNEEQDDELESSDSSASDYNSDSGPKSSRKRKSKKTTKKTNITVASNSQLLEPISQSQSEQHGSLYGISTSPKREDIFFNTNHPIFFFR